MAVSGQQQTAGSILNGMVSYSCGRSQPVFRGLEGVAVRDKDIAAIAGVAPPVFSKWRSGRVRVPENKLVLLTLLLAHWIDEMESMPGERDRRVEIRLKTTRRCLLHQEVINRTLPPEAVREGSHLFRKWWFREGGVLKIKESLNQ